MTFNIRIPSKHSKRKPRNESKMSDNSHFTDIHGIAKLLGKSIPTIHRWKKKRFIPYHQTQPNAPILFDVEIVKEWWRGLHTYGRKRLY
ncbi:DUF3853 family protein [Fibrobacterota bacterium]